MATREHGLYRRYETPPADAAKGGCYLTHDSGAGVDTGVLIDFEGDLCLSLVAIKELAEVAGFSVNAEAEQLERDNAWLVVENQRIQQERDELEGLLDGLTSTIARGTKK
jgi:hypothetical protein